MADERYQKLLGIDPADETPTYYELFCIDRSETDEGTIEAAYKTQIRKLQAIRTSKDKGFIEFLKEELRKARRILTNPERRKEYDLSLEEDAVEAFKEFVQPLMALGQITRSVFDTMVAKGVSDGLEESVAAKIITEMAAESGATVELDEDLENSGYDEVEPDDGPYVEETYDREYVDIPDEGPRPPGETVLTAAAAPPRRPSEVGRVEPRSDAGRVPEPEPEPAAPTGPWLRGLDGPQRPWSRRRGTSWTSNRPVQARRPRAQGGRSGQGRISHKHRQPAPAPPPSGSGGSRELEEAVRLFNLGAKLAKIASDVHEKLRFYFPPANGKTERTKQINGVSYEKVFDTEQKMYRDTLKKFETAQSRADAASGAQADQLRQKSTQNIALIKGYLDEIRQHKLRRLAGLSKNEELRAWQEFVSNRRSSRVSQMIGEG